MRIKTSGAIEAVSGAHGNFVYITRRNGLVKAMNRGGKRVTDQVGARKSTSEQKLIQSYLRDAAGNWQTLTDMQRAAWNSYANAYFNKDEKGRTVTPTGLSTYIRANSIRRLLGLAMTLDAPTQAPPAPVTTVSQVSGANPDTVSVIVSHSYASVAGHVALVSMTAPGRSDADAPGDNGFRLVRGATALSSLPLPASGGMLTFTPTRYNVADGQRYGVEVRVIRLSDGLGSSAAIGDFRKEV